MQQAEKSFNMRLFGKRLISARIEAGYDTSTALAQAIGVGKSTVTRWENGSNVPAYETLITLSKLLHVSCDYLLMDIPAEHRNAAEKYGLSNEALTVLEEMNKMEELESFALKWRGNRQVNPVDFINSLLTICIDDMTNIPLIKKIALEGATIQKATQIYSANYDEDKYYKESYGDNKHYMPGTPEYIKKLNTVSKQAHALGLPAMMDGDEYLEIKRREIIGRMQILIEQVFYDCMSFRQQTNQNPLTM